MILLRGSMTSSYIVSMDNDCPDAKHQGNPYKKTGRRLQFRSHAILFTMLIKKNCTPVKFTTKTAFQKPNHPFWPVD